MEKEGKFAVYRKSKLTIMRYHLHTLNPLRLLKNFENGFVFV